MLQPIKWAQINTPCWIFNDHKLIPGVILQVSPFLISTAEGNIADPKNVYQRSLDNLQELEDLMDLSILNEAEILNALHHKFQQKKFQIFCGASLLIINPFHKENAKSQLLQQIAQNAYHQMTDFPQSIILTGESGSGKSEISKQIQLHLSKFGNLHSKVLACNQIIEAFGNARTQRNSNSSRYGRVTKMLFDKEQKLCGVHLSAVSLEKSRIYNVPQGECNFNILYQFLNHGQLALFNINTNQQQNLIPNPLNSKASQQQSSKEAQQFQDTLDALKLFNINIDVILGLLACIIKLGNIQFDDHDNDCSIQDQKSIVQISHLLGISDKELIRCLCYKQRQLLKNEVVDTPLSRIECINQQQNIIKQLYERLFEFLIDSINCQMSTQTNKYQISIIDYFGFEQNIVNSFEQLLINYSQEKLHQFYLFDTFLCDSKIFQQEGLTNSQGPIYFMNNLPILECLERPPLGILNILDDSCTVAGTDETFLTKVKNAFVNNQIITYPKSQSQPIFKVRHFAREVEYNVIGFRIKNKDEVNKQFQILLQKSKNQYISTMYQQIITQKYVGTVARTELSSLVSSLKDSSNQYIRCIKSNDQLIQDQFNQQFVLNQIKYCCVVESLQMRKEGYAYRRTYQQCYFEFFAMVQQKKVDYKAGVINYMKKSFAFTDDQVLFGNRMVFFKYQTYRIIQQEIKKQNNLKHQAASKLQNAWICYKNKMIFREFQCRVIYIQAHIRGYLERQRYVRLMQSIVFIQFKIREWLKKIKYKRNLQATKVVQTYFKRICAIKQMIVEEQCAIKIQRFIREKQLYQDQQVESDIKKLLYKVTDQAWKVIVYRAATKIQKTWKGYITRLINEDNIQSIKLAGFLVTANQAAIAIQKYVRGQQQRRYYQSLRAATTYIQGWIRSKWLTNLFQRIRYATIVIQRGVRKYYNQYRKQRKYEDLVLKPLENELNRIREQEFMNLHDSYIENILDADQENIPGKKIDLFSQVIDLEILTDVSEIYDTLWTSLYKRCFKECYEKQNYISTYSIGECHAYVGTLQNKIYSWGLNDSLQQGLLKQNANKINSIQFPFKVKSIKSGANHGLILSQDNVLYSTDEKQSILKNVKLFSVYNDDNVAVDENNLIYIWKKKHKSPIELKSWTTFIRMSQIQQKIQVHQISHGLSFFIVLSTNGMMFSMGENTVGELGINRGHSKNELTLIELSDKIAEVHCGMKHTIAKSTLGKVYTWGWGQMGQLGHGNLKDEAFPKMLPFESKVLQVMAGHKQSIVILDTRKIYWWGTNSCLQYQTRPVEYMTNYPAIRVLCSWSRTLSVVYITFAKTYKCIDNNIKLKNKIINQMVSKWSENDIYSLDPPYCDNLANYFNQMKKPQQKLNIKFASKIEHQQLVKQLQQSPFNLLDEVKDTSCFFSFKNESNIQLQRQLLEHSENTDIINAKSYHIDNSNKLKLLKSVKKYRNDPQLQEILKQSELTIKMSEENKSEQQLVFSVIEEGYFDQLLKRVLRKTQEPQHQISLKEAQAIVNTVSRSSDLQSIKELGFKDFVGYLQSIRDVYIEYRKFQKKVQSSDIPDDLDEMVLGCYNTVPAYFFDQPFRFNYQLFSLGKEKINQYLEEIKDHLDDVEITLFFQINSRFDKFLSVILNLNEMNQIIDQNIKKVKRIREIYSVTREHMIKKSTEITKKKQTIEKVENILFTLKRIQSIQKSFVTLTELINTKKYSQAVQLLKVSEQTYQTIKSITGLKFIPQKLEQLQKTLQTTILNHLLSIMLTQMTSLLAPNKQLINQINHQLNDHEDSVLANSYVNDSWFEQQQQSMITINKQSDDSFIKTLLSSSGIIDMADKIFKQKVLEELQGYYQEFLIALKNFFNQEETEQQMKFDEQSIMEQISQYLEEQPLSIFIKIVQFFSENLKKTINLQIALAQSIAKNVLDQPKHMEIIEEHFSIPVAMLKFANEKVALLLSSKRIASDSTVKDFVDLLQVYKFWDQFFQQDMSRINEDLQINDKIMQKIRGQYQKCSINQLIYMRSAQEKQYLQNFHKEKKTQLNKYLENETWLASDVSFDNYEIITYLLDLEDLKQVEQLDESVLLNNSTMAGKNLLPSYVNNSHFKIIKTEIIILKDNSKYKVTQAFLFFLQAISQYLHLFESYSVINYEQTQKLVELIKCYNSLATQYILGAGAVHFGKISTITAKNLAISSICLRLFLYLLDPLSNKLFKVINQQQQTEFTNLQQIQNDFATIKVDYENHNAEVMAKLTTIVQDRFYKLFEDIAKLDWNDSQTKITVPTKMTNQICQNTRSLYVAIEDIITKEDLCKVFGHIVSILNSDFVKIFKQLNITSKIGFTRIKEELDYFMNSLKDIGQLPQFLADQYKSLESDITTVIESKQQ
ncbi:unnamed protein product [Paramecium octaurelia]|uniref:Myosin motor domain-containing protein n=1 Tax=Paramecium octaurelia TaxID=43137 RepID=A0A8S1STG3_PAROT|nr:unnamed protein product [Paramecium octaurelia]